MASASRRSRRRDVTALPTARPRQPEREPVPLDDVPSAVAHPAFQMSRRNWILLYLILFAAIQAVLLFFFFGVGGEDRVRKKMLVRADDLARRGEHAAVVELYGDYARRWPGAVGTPNFERALGEAYYNIADFAVSAQHYERSVRADPTVWDRRALAGQSHWQAGNKSRAIELFREELESGNPESDLANSYLGMYELEQGNPAAAARHIQSIRDRAAYEDKIAQAHRRIEEEILRPAREEAKRLSAE